jgi:hypothetical protein
MEAHHNVPQVGVTSLGVDGTVELNAGDTSVPLERWWIAVAVASLRG